MYKSTQFAPKFAYLRSKIEIFPGAQPPPQTPSTLVSRSSSYGAILEPRAGTTPEPSKGPQVVVSEIIYLHTYRL